MAKQAIVYRIEAIALRCPDCQGGCESQQGSFMIEQGDLIVTCVDCGQNLEVPQSAFVVRQPARQTRANVSHAKAKAKMKENK